MSNQGIVSINRLKKELQLIKNQTYENFVIRVDENDMLKWYFIIHNLEGPYKDGFYSGYIQVSREYPFKPCDFYFINENG